MKSRDLLGKTCHVQRLSSPKNPTGKNEKQMNLFQVGIINNDLLCVENSLKFDKCIYIIRSKYGIYIKILVPLIESSTY